MIEFRRPYQLLALLYMGGIFWLSSRSDLGIRAVDVSLLHVPLYAGLVFCVVKALSETLPRQAIPCRVPGFALVVSATYAVIDEWHQSFVPGRDASLGDLYLDLTGIGLTLLLGHLSEERNNAQP